MSNPGRSLEPTDPAWVPGPAARSRSRLLSAIGRWGFSTFDDLQREAISNPEWFWREVVEDLGVTFRTPFHKVVDQTAGKEFPRWFVGGTINAADLCSHRHADGPSSTKPAIVFEGDAGQCRSLTFAQLDQEVRRFAANLIDRGVGRGDRVVLFMPVAPEATVAFLSCAMIGAIVVPAFSGYGAEALAVRVRDSGAIALVTADGTTRRGKRVPLKETADEALAEAPSVRSVIVVRHLDDGAPMLPGRDVYWDDMVSDLAPAETLGVDANDPLALIYTSGTTGAPKGIVHSHAGLAVKAAVDFAYGFDLHDDDVVAWITDMGWMLGPLLIMGVLQLGATVVMVEGVPTYPTPDRLWQIAGRHSVTIQGIAPTAARGIKNVGAGDISGLASVRSFVSTGEAWDDPTWRWLYETVGGATRPIINYSGGTETGGGIVVTYPFLPSHAASFNGPLPGMDVAVFDDLGQPVVGEIGELVVRNIWPGMTHSFWGDDDRYLETYWSRWPGVWQHGDLASIDGRGTWRVVGRSDDTIKVSGRRVGPAEIEAGILKDSRISEAAAVGVPDDERGQRIVAFVVLRDDLQAADVAADLDVMAAHHVGRAFAPRLHIVSNLPKTKNGKIMRRAIRSRYLGEPAGDMSALDPATPLENIPTHDDSE